MRYGPKCKQEGRALAYGEEGGGEVEGGQRSQNDTHAHNESSPSDVNNFLLRSQRIDRHHGSDEEDGNQEEEEDEDDESR